MSAVTLERRPLGKPGRITLTDFLLARITESEAIALRSGPQRDRRLAECWSQRHLVHLHDGPDHGCLEAFPCTTLRIMALPYTCHYDFDARWRPASSGMGGNGGRHLR